MTVQSAIFFVFSRLLVGNWFREIGKQSVKDQQLFCNFLQWNRDWLETVILSFFKNKNSLERMKSFPYKLSSCMTTRAATFTKFGNVYKSSNKRNNSVYVELPDFIFFIMQIGEIADIFP